MNSATAIGINGTDVINHGSFAYAGAAKLSTVRNPTATLLISDISYDVGFVAIPWKEYYFRRYSTFRGQAVYRAGFKHGATQPSGRVNIVFMDSHVEDRNLDQTNSFVQKWY
jgi:prepilin-type processing-associated H-X9-DG protein